MVHERVALREVCTWRDFVHWVGVVSSAVKDGVPWMWMCGSQRNIVDRSCPAMLRSCCAIVYEVCVRRSSAVWTGVDRGVDLCVVCTTCVYNDSQNTKL